MDGHDRTLRFGRGGQAVGDGTTSTSLGGMPGYLPGPLNTLNSATGRLAALWRPGPLSLCRWRLPSPV